VPDPQDPVVENVSADLLAQHPRAIARALADGERPLPDGTWQAADGRVFDPQLSDGKLVPLNVGFLYSLPILVAITVPITALTVGLSWVDFAAFFVMWLVAGLGITAGYHRLFSHRAYKASWPVRAFFAIAGCMAVQNSILVWSRDHRYHHAMVDTIGDPYNARRGVWYSHFGWIMRRGPHAEDLSNVADLQADPIVAWQHRHYSWLVWVANFGLVLALGAVTGRWIQMFVIVGLLRVLFVQHGTFLINSWAHAIGSQPWSTSSSAKDSWLLSLLTFGEGYHNYHHVFASDYRNGIYWYHWDPTKWLIWALHRAGLAWDLKRIPLEVSLSHRVQQTRRSFASVLFEAGEGQFEDWAEALRRRQTELVSAMEHGRDELMSAVEHRREQIALQILATETAMEDAFSELRRRRRLWKGGAGRQELRELQRAVREGQREVRARWAEFERLVAQYQGIRVPVAVVASTRRD
jgi:stearoyl-CoA desaturase (delta-9 desaturase)